MAHLAELGDAAYRHRCDKLTFRALASAFGNRELLEGHEYGAPGQFHRDVETCYPGDSRSEISLDGYLSLAHHIWTYQDDTLLQRIISYGRNNGFVMGEGPIKYTNILLLVPTLYGMQSKLTLVDFDSLLAGYKGHIVALYIHLKGRVNGRISDLELHVLEQLVRSNENNPLYQAIYHTYLDGDQSEAISILMKDFPPDFPSGEAKYGWGSAPDSVVFITTVGILEGR